MTEEDSLLLLMMSMIIFAFIAINAKAIFGEGE